MGRLGDLGGPSTLEPVHSSSKNLLFVATNAERQASPLPNLRALKPRPVQSLTIEPREVVWERRVLENIYLQPYRYFSSCSPLHYICMSALHLVIVTEMVPMLEPCGSQAKSSALPLEMFG